MKALNENTANLAIALHNGALRRAPRMLVRWRRIETPEWNAICSGKGVFAVQTVKAALAAPIAVVALVVSLLPALAGENESLALTISIEGAIGPAAAGQVKQALATAAERRAEIVILR